MRTHTNQHTNTHAQVLRVHSFHKLLALVTPAAATGHTFLSQEDSPHKHTVLGDYVIYKGFITVEWYLVNICFITHQQSITVQPLLILFLFLFHKTIYSYIRLNIQLIYKYVIWVYQLCIRLLMCQFFMLTFTCWFFTGCTVGHVHMHTNTLLNSTGTPVRVWLSDVVMINQVIEGWAEFSFSEIGSIRSHFSFAGHTNCCIPLNHGALLTIR